MRGGGIVERKNLNDFRTEDPTFIRPTEIFDSPEKSFDNRMMICYLDESSHGNMPLYSTPSRETSASGRLLYRLIRCNRYRLHKLNSDGDDCCQFTARHPIIMSLRVHTPPLRTTFQLLLFTVGRTREQRPLHTRIDQFPRSVIAPESECSFLKNVRYESAHSLAMGKDGKDDQKLQPP